MTGGTFHRTVDLADGRTVEVRRGGPLEPWNVQATGQPAAVGQDLWLLRALDEALAPSNEKPSRAPDYVFALMDELLGADTEIGRRYPCPCCDLLTLTEVDMDLICPVCRWQDSVGQKRNPDSDGGANLPSLRQARENYARLGTSDPREPTQGRSPLAAEIPDPRN